MTEPTPVTELLRRRGLLPEEEPSTDFEELLRQEGIALPKKKPPTTAEKVKRELHSVYHDISVKRGQLQKTPPASAPELA